MKKKKEGKPTERKIYVKINLQNDSFNISKKYWCHLCGLVSFCESSRAAPKRKAPQAKNACPNYFTILPF